MDNHIIIMRFNQDLKVSFSPTNMYEGEDSWMSHRLKLFKKYTLKGFQNQSDKHFHIFFLCDPNTPKEYKEELTTLKSTLPQISIIYSNKSGNDKDLLNEIKSKYLKIRKNTSNEVIISRCDNDDLISVNYNYAVKLATETYHTINLGCGLTYSIEQTKINKFLFPSSPFISIKSNLEDFHTPYNKHHMEIDSTFIETDHPMWCWVIHDRNANNSMKGEPTNLTKEDLKLYFGYE